MSRLHGRLTALAVKHATERGLYGDGAGLVLQVARGGSKSWLLRYRFNGARRHLGLGGFSSVTLAEARERAAAARTLLAKGEDPVAARRGQRISAVLNAAKTILFRDAADRYITTVHAHGKTEKNTTEWRASLDNHAAKLAPLPVNQIDTALVMQVLEPIWLSKNATAAKLRERIERILDWAKVSGYRDCENPARWDGHLENLLPSKTKVAKVEHHAAMAYAELPTFMAKLRARTDIAARALEFAILTAARSGEVLHADWSEIDLQARTWTVPAGRMKAGKVHRVPLTNASMALLGALPGPQTGFVFPGFRDGKSLAKMALVNAMKRAGGDATVHGFRSSFRDWAGDHTAFDRDVIEAALAHTVGNSTEQAYRRSSALEKRLLLMQAWANYVDGKVQPTATVTELKRA